MAWTTPSTWVAAAVVTAAQLNQQIRDNLKAIGDPWTTYTPTYTNITIGNAVVVAKYLQAGKDVRGEVKITFGSTSAWGAGNLQVSLPAVPATTNIVIGMAWVYDSSAGANTLVTPLTTGTALCPFIGTGIPAVTNTVPFTWAVNDVLSFSFSYEAA